MSPVVLALDLLLASLLVLTLVLGVRLNGRLKGLKQSHAGFEKAVAELNQAAARAEAGLAALRETSAEAHDALLARIDTARSLVTRLERANFQAEKAAEAVVRAKAELPSVAASRADAAVSRLAMSGPPAPSAPAPAASMPNALATIAALVGDGPAAGRAPVRRRRAGRRRRASRRVADARRSTRTCSKAMSPAPRRAPPPAQPTA
jgi:hypothetical protein